MRRKILYEIIYTLGYARHWKSVKGIEKTLEIINQGYKEDTGEKKDIIKLSPFFDYIKKKYGSKNC